jgi:hypothetical protein
MNNENLINKCVCDDFELIKMSSKNTLQEYCQKNGQPLPIYTTVRINDRSLMPLFESTLVFNGTPYTARGATKVAAEKQVATEVLPHLSESVAQIGAIGALRQKYASLTDIPNDTYQLIYLIDGDNCHVTHEEMFMEIHSLFIYFVAKNNSHRYPFAHQEKYANCCVFISDSIGRDATDHLLTFYLGKMSILWATNKTYYIVTLDHFGECLEKFMQNCHFICKI